MCTRTVQGTLEVRIVSHCLKTFLNLHKLLKQTCVGDLGIEGIQRKLFADNTYSLKRRHELQRFLDEVLADPKAVNSPYTIEFLGLKRRPDRVVPKMTVKAWKDLSMLESYDYLASELATARKERAALMNENRALTADVKVATEYARGCETRKLFVREIEALHSSEIGAVRDWANARVSALQAELAERQTHVCLLTQASNALETENERLRVELQTAKARFLVYERALEAAAAAAADPSTKLCDSSGNNESGSSGDGSDKISVERLQHENMALRMQLLRLEGLANAIRSDRDALSRGFEESTLRQGALEKELRSKLDAVTAARDTAHAELRKKDEYIDLLTQEKEEYQAQLDAVTAESTRLGECCTTLEGDVAARDLTVWLLRYQVRQLLREVAAMTVERDRYGIEPPRTPRTLLMYSGQYGEGLSALETVERENVACREQMLRDAGRIKALAADVEDLRKEAAAAAAKLREEKERCERYELLLEQNNVPVEDISSDKVSDVVTLRAEVETLQKELASVKQKYFFDLAVAIKIQTHSTREIAELYNDLLAEAVPVDGWIKWINKKMAESPATPPTTTAASANSQEHTATEPTLSGAPTPVAPAVASSGQIAAAASSSTSSSSSSIAPAQSPDDSSTNSSNNSAAALTAMFPPSLYYSSKMIRKKLN